MNCAKQKYENLLLLFNRLCKSSTNEYYEIINGISYELEDIKKYDLFPIDLPDSFYKRLSKDAVLDFKENKLKIAKDLYIFLAKLMFSFDQTTVPETYSYRKVLELGRTEFPFEQANEWCQEYVESTEFERSRFFFCLNREQLVLSTKDNFQKYSEELRSDSIDIPTSFPKETSLEKELLSSVYSIMENKLRLYQDYIEKNYKIIRHAFPFYNKQIRVYITRTSKEKQSYEYTINVYDTLLPGISIYPYDVKLAYRFSNIEAIEQKPSYSLLAMFTYPNCIEMGKLFDEFSIHHELNSLYTRYASFYDLRDYLVYMLRGQLKDVSIISDYEIKIDKKRCLLFFEEIPTIKILQLDLKRRDYEYVAFRFYPDDATKVVLKEANISVIIVQQLGQALINNQNGEMIHWFIKSRISNLLIDDSLKELSIGDVLIKKLKNCPKGKDGWKQYEDIGGEIFHFLFSDTFRNYSFEYQSINADGTFRRDLIINNTYSDSPSFWQLVKDDYNSNLIIIDFKNYQQTLTPDEFYNPSKYMNKLAGNFVIILSRCGLDESAKKFQIKLLEDNKLVMCLSDANLIDLINQKVNGQNPLYSLENMYYTLCKNK